MRVELHACEWSFVTKLLCTSLQLSCSCAFGSCVDVARFECLMVTMLLLLECFHECG